jgi:hypothetical protein
MWICGYVSTKLSCECNKLWTYLLLGSNFYFILFVCKCSKMCGFTKGRVFKKKVVDIACSCDLQICGFTKVWNIIF